MAGKVDAQFAIDIASSMSGGEQTTAELDALTQQMLGAGKGADFFQEAIKQLSGDLSAAGAASAAANAELAAGEATYRRLEAAALQAAKAAEKAAVKGGDQSEEFLKLSAAALSAKGAVADYSGTLKRLEGAAAGAAKTEAELATQLGNVKKLSGHVDKTLARQAESLSKLGGALGAIGGPLGGIGQKLTAPVKGFTELSGVMGGTNAAAVLATVGVAGLAAALVAAGVGAAFGLAKIAKWAVKLSDKEGKLAAQTDKLESNFNELFSGLNIEPVIRGVEILAGLFDKTTAAGESLQFLFESIFQPIIDQAESAAYVVEAFYLGFLIGATKLYIAIKPILQTVAELFGFEDDTFADMLVTAKDAGEIFAYVVAALAIVFGVLVAAVVAVVAVMAGLVASLAAVPIILGEVAAAVMGFFVKAFTSAVEFIRGIDFVAIGTNIMQGLAAGITGAAGAVLNAITGAVKGAINAAKSLLGIASPSKVFAELGSFTGEGFTMGVEAENDNAHAALAEMADPNAALAATASPLAATASPTDNGGAAPAAPATGGGGTVYDFTNAVITFSGVKDAPSGIEQFRDMLIQVTRGESLAAGGSR